MSTSVTPPRRPVDGAQSPVHSVRQPTLFGDCEVKDAVETLAAAGVEARGAIFTKRQVVDFILDLAGYTTDAALKEMRLLEPSFGNGDFLIPAVERLLNVWIREDRGEPALKALGGCIRGVELHRATFERTKSRVEALLKGSGLSAEIAAALTAQWLIHGDFLLVPLEGAFDVVVGNPPYVRQELIPDALLAEYRSRYRTIYDRADLYIPFIERSLTSLGSGGRLAFICADRWMKNRYGGPLRRLVSGNFHLKIYVDMVGTPAFHTDVIAYPGITVISREKGMATRVAYRPGIHRDVLASLSTALLTDGNPTTESGVREIQNVVVGEEPWIFDAVDQVGLIRRLEATFSPLEEAGCKVGIGVATGADKVFIGNFEELDVEPERKLRLVTTRDILTGDVQWQGLGVVNPFDDEGGLVKLTAYPRLKHYLEARKEEIACRHVAKKAPTNWYRTIDLIVPSIALQPKLLIPDIKGDAHVVYEEGRLYPHHNLYYIVADKWHLKALQAVLLSGIARLFVSTYSTKMHGGFLRFQAQYLRRIRIPQWANVPSGIQRRLIDAADRKDVIACNDAVFELYGLTAVERAVLAGMEFKNAN